MYPVALYTKHDKRLERVCEENETGGEYMNVDNQSEVDVESNTSGEYKQRVHMTVMDAESGGDAAQCSALSDVSSEEKKVRGISGCADLVSVYDSLLGFCRITTNLSTNFAHCSRWHGRYCIHGRMS